MYVQCIITQAESLTTIILFKVGLLRPFVFYNQLAIGQKDRLTGQP